MDRSDIDAELVRRLVERQFPQWAGLPVRPVDLPGWDHLTFRLGDGLAVRLPSGEGYAEQVAKEQRWLPVLAPHLPLPVPRPVGLGEPGEGYPYAWSVYAWLDGTPCAEEDVVDLVAFASELAGFLRALGRVDATDGPAPGQHSWLRGAPISVYAEQTRATLDRLAGLDPDDQRLAAFGAWSVAELRDIFDAGAATVWEQPPVWFHGDVAVGNLLTRDGRLSAVIDFGCCGVGDPACDLVIAWTLLHGPSRARFRTAMDLDDATWARGRAWALWKAVITLAEAVEEPALPARPLRDLARVAADSRDER